jgi:Icc protein
LRVLQFTDPHLSGSPDMRVRGVATAETLARCLAHARHRHPKPDAFLLTGDLVHDDPAGYALLRAQFADAGAPVHCLPGNHDQTADVSEALDGPPFVHDFVRRHGKEQLARLDAALAAQPDAQALVCLHHHPVPHGSAWLDELMLDNAEDFFAVLARHDNVRAVAWGHTHQPFEGVRGHIRLMGTPSTCMQFAQNAPEFEVDDRPPAYRWIDLGPGGGIETGIEWVDEHA